MFFLFNVCCRKIRICCFGLNEVKLANAERGTISAFAPFYTNRRHASKLPKKRKDADSLISKIADSSFGYRLQGKVFLLSYSQVGDTELVLLVDTLVNKIKSSFPLESYTGTCELHKDGGRHFHVVLTMKKRINTTDSKIFDSLGLHPNIAVVRSPKKALEYILKSFNSKSTPGTDALYSSFSLEDLRPFFGVYKKSDDNEIQGNPYNHIYLKLVSNKNYSILDAMGVLSKHDPVNTIKNYKKVFQNLVFIKSQHADYSTSFVDFFKYNLSFTGELMRWLLIDYRTHVLCLMGPTRVGKTTLALQLGGKNPLVINEINGLAFLIPGHHTSIIFNDFNFSELGDQMLTKLLGVFDMKTPSTIRILFQSIYIPAYLPKIVTSNLDLSKSISIDPAIEARLKFVYLSNFVKIDRLTYDVELPNLISCSYDKSKKFISGSNYCVTSTVLFSFFSTVKKELKYEKQFKEFKEIYPKKITYTQSVLIKSLNRMYQQLAIQFPSLYTFVSIYEAFQYYTIQNKPVLDLGNFIYRCSRLYKHYTFESTTPKAEINCTIFDIIYDQPMELADEYTLTTPNKTKESGLHLLENYKSFVPDPFFCSLRPYNLESHTQSDSFNYLSKDSNQYNTNKLKNMRPTYSLKSSTLIIEDQISDGLSDVFPIDPPSENTTVAVNTEETTNSEISSNLEDSCSQVKNEVVDNNSSYDDLKDAYQKAKLDSAKADINVKNALENLKLAKKKFDMINHIINTREKLSESITEEDIITIENILKKEVTPKKKLDLDDPVGDSFDDLPEDISYLKDLASSHIVSDTSSDKGKDKP
jgi:hypothetical protein